VESLSARQAARTTAALVALLGDEAAAAWYVERTAAGRICRYRLDRLLLRCRAVVIDALSRSDPGDAALGDPIGVRLASVYARGELARLATRCGVSRPGGDQA
jgi:hypothetical protein